MPCSAMGEPAFFYARISIKESPEWRQKQTWMPGWRGGYSIGQNRDTHDTGYGSQMLYSCVSW